MRDGSAEGKTEAAGALQDADNKVRIAREGLGVIKTAHGRETDSAVRKELYDLIQRLA